MHQRCVWGLRYLPPVFYFHVCSWDKFSAYVLPLKFALHSVWRRLHKLILTCLLPTQISKLHLYISLSVPLYFKSFQHKKISFLSVWSKHFHSSAFSVLHASIRRVLMPSVSMTGLQSFLRIQQLGGFFCLVHLTRKERQKCEQSLCCWPETILVKLFVHFSFS